MADYAYALCGIEDQGRDVGPAIFKFTSNFPKVGDKIDASHPGILLGNEILTVLVVYSGYDEVALIDAHKAMDTLSGGHGSMETLNNMLCKTRDANTTV